MTEHEACNQIMQHIREQNITLEPQLIEALRMSIKSLSLADKISTLYETETDDFEYMVKDSLINYKQSVYDEEFLWRQMKRDTKRQCANEHISTRHSKLNNWRN